MLTCWRQLANDDNLAPAVTDNFLRLMSSVELYEDPYHLTENHVAALQPLTVSILRGNLLATTWSMTINLAYNDDA